MFFLLDGVPLTLIRVNWFNLGSFHAYQSTSVATNSIIHGGFLTDSYNNETLTFAALSEVSSWKIIRFNMTTQSTYFTITGPTGAQPSRAYTVIIGKSATPDLIVGGVLTEIATGITYSSITRVLANGTYLWHFGLSQGITPSNFYYYVKKLYLFSTSTLYGCGESKGSAANAGSLLFFSLSWNSTQSIDNNFQNIHQLSNLQINQCIEIYSSSTSTLYALIFIESTSQMIFTTLSSFSSTPAMSSQILDSLTSTAGFQHSMYTGAFMKEYNSKLQIYYAGTGTSIQYYTSSQTYTKQQGFIMTYDDVQTCLTFTNSVLSGTLSSLTGQSFSNFSQTLLNNTSPGFISVSTISVSSNLTNPNLQRDWCESKYPVTITAPEMDDQYCYSNLSVGFNVSTTNNTNCDDSYPSSPQMSYDVQNSDGTKTASYISMSSWNQQFTCTNSYIYQNGTYDLMYEIISANWYTIDLPFKLNMEDRCKSLVTLGSSNLVNQTYIILDPTLNYNVPDFSILGMFDSLNCFISGYFSISVVPPTNAITISNNVLKVYANTNTLINNYTVTITQALNIKNYTFSASFNVELKDMCIHSSIIAYSNPSYSYDIDERTTNIAGTYGWSQNVSYCNTYYPIDYWVYVVPNSTIFQNLSSNQISVFTESPSDLGTYSIQVDGNVSIYASASKRFQVTVTNNCPTCSITTTSLSNCCYYRVGSSILNMTYASWVPQYSYCGSASYSLAASLDPIFQFSSTTRSISLMTTDVAKAGLYDIEIIGIFPNGSTTSKLVKIQVIDPCPTAALSNPPTQIFQYLLRSDQQIYSIGNFTSNETASICGDWQYLYDFGGLANAYISSSGNQIYVNSSDFTTGGIYTITVTAWQGTYNTHTITQQFTLKMIDTCLSVTIYSPIFPPPVYFVRKQAMNIQLPFFNDSLNGLCGLYTYSIQSLNPILNFTVLNFSTDTLQGSVYSDDPLSIGMYYFNLTGTLPHNYGSLNFNMSFLIDCDVENISSSDSTQIYKYKVGSTVPLIIPFSEFIKFPNCRSFSFTYSLTIKRDLNKAFSKFSSIDSYGRVIKVMTSDIQNIGIYQIGVNGTLNDSVSFNSVPLTFEVQVYGSPPIFKSSPLNLTRVVGTEYVYTLPPTIGTYGLAANVSVNLLSVAFIKFGSNQLTLKPLQQDIGTHQLLVTLTDSIFPYLVTQSVIEVEVVQIKESIVESNTEDIQDGWSLQQKANKTIQKTLEIPDSEPILVNNTSIKAKIKFISKDGIMNISFSQEMQIPNNTKIINGKSESIISFQRRIQY